MIKAYLDIIIKIFNEHLNFKQQIIKLAKIDLVKTYRGAALGWLWAVIKPCMTIGIYWFAFEIGLRVAKPTNGYPYWIWLVIGLVPWFYMSSMLTDGANSMKKYSYLITKMKFPVSTIPTFVSISKLLEHLAILFIVIIIYISFGFKVDIYFLQLPLYILCMYIFFTIWALFAAPLTVLNKDFFNLIRSSITPIFWLSGIMWNPDTIKIKWVKTLLKFNPFTYISNGYRNVFINKVWFWENAHTTRYFVFVTGILLILALISYKRLHKDLADSL